MPCKLCKTQPVYKLQNGIPLCKICFIKYLENKVFKTIRKHNLLKLNDKIVCAVSGGKDSITTLYLLQKYLKQKNLHHNLSALAIDEGIKGYRKQTLTFLKKFTKQLQIPLHITSFKNQFGKTLDKQTKKLKKTNISPCNLCGTLRRYALNTHARKLKATKLATGHNADDEAQNILLNIFKNNFNVLSRLGPNNGIVTDKKFIPRIKPLYHCTEKEIRLYTILKGFDIGFDECPYSKNTFRKNISEILNHLEDEHKGIKHSTINFYLQTKNALKQSFIKQNGSQITHCTKCFEPSQKQICNTCEIKKLIKN